MKEQVILFSGGMDSIMLATRFPEAVLLYVPTGSAYETKERARLPDLPGLEVITAPGRIDLSSYERDDAIVPSRNAYLALVAANYGRQIMLGATAGDMSTDKDDKWAGMMTGLLRYMLSGKHFPNGGKHRVLLPIKHLTKGELVRDYIASGHDPAVLAHSISCYTEGTTGHCGHCKACIRKWAAMEYNGVDTTVWDAAPWEAPAWNEVITLWKRRGTWRTYKEDAYTFSVLRQRGVFDT